MIKKNSPPSIWVLILNWNGMDHLAYMLPSFLSCDYSENVHLLFVDACSTDNSVAYANKVAGDRLKYLQLTENRGWATGNNAAIRHAAENGAEYVVLVNNDMKFSLRWLSDSMEVFTEKEDAGVVGCRIFNDLHAFEKAKGEYQKMQYTKTSFIPGCCMIIPVAVLSKIGLFNEEYQFYADEDDFEARAMKAGYTLYETNTPIWHFHDGSMRLFPEKKAFLAMRNAMLFSRRYEPVYRTLAITVKILLCAVIKNFRKQTMMNRRYYVKSPLFNLRIFLQALHWNMRDIWNRGYRSPVIPPRLGADVLSDS